MKILAINEQAIKPHAELVNDFKLELDKVLQLGQINYKPIDVLLYDDSLIVSINGAFAYKPDELEKIFLGVIDYQDVIDKIDDYKTGVKNIVLNINSPGGTVQGIKILSDYIQSLDIPTIAYTDNYLYSAGYWIASSCDKFYAHTEAFTGSIGVIAVHQEYSQAIKDEGIGQTIFRAGSRKAKPSPLEPLDAVDIMEMQDSVDESYRDFVNHVSNSRGLSLDDVDKWADGKTFNAAKALELGLIDGVVKSLDDVIGLVNQMDNDLTVLDKADGQLSANNIVKNDIYNQDMTINNNTVSQSDLEMLQQSLDAIKADNETIKQSNADLQKENEELKSKLLEVEKAPLIAQLTESEKAILADLPAEKLKALIDSRQVQTAQAAEEQPRLDVMQVAGSIKQFNTNTSCVVDAIQRGKERASKTKFGGFN